jgi:hypothetical protein
MICSRKEFCDLAGCSKANLSTYIKRGNVLLEDDGKHIDTERRENKDFLKRRESAGKASIPGSKAPTITQQVPKAQIQEAIPPIPTPAIKPTRKVQRAAESATISKYELELEKMQADVNKKYIDTQLAEQRLSILLGNNIPIDLVKSIVSQLAKSMIQNYKSFGEQEISEICHQFSIPERDRVRFVEKNLKGLNAIHLKSVNDANMQLKSAMGLTKYKEAQTDTEDDN